MIFSKLALNQRKHWAYCVLNFCHRYTGHKNTEYRIDSCLDHTDNYVISGSEDGTVYMWSLVEGQLLCTLQHTGSRVVHSLSPHPSKPWLITAAQNSIYVWKDQPEDES